MDRIEQQRNVVAQAISHVGLEQADGAFLLHLACVSLDAVPQTPTRRCLNEYFASFGRAAEPGFLLPPDYTDALSAEQLAMLQGEVVKSLADREPLIAGCDWPDERADLLDVSRREALTVYNGSHPGLWCLEIRLLAACIEAQAWDRGLELWCSVPRLLRQQSRGGDLPADVQASLRTIKDAERSLCKFLDEVKPAIGAALAETMKADLGRLSNQPLSPPRQQDRFAALRQASGRLDASDPLRLRVEEQLSIYETSTDATRVNAQTMLEHLKNLPPLRAIQSINPPSVGTRDERNALRASLTAAFSAHVVGHKDKCARLVEEILAMYKGGNGKGFSIIMWGAPGVGKNTLAKAIAKALGREFICHALNGKKESDEILGSRQVWVGAAPGLAPDALLKQKKPAVVMWDEVGKSGQACQNALNSVVDPDNNHAVYDSYFATVPLDFSGFIHVLAYNKDEPIVPSLKDRAIEVFLDDLTHDEKGQVLNLKLPELCAKYLHDGKMDLPEDTRDVLVQRRSDQPGARVLVNDLAELLGWMQNRRDAGEKGFALTPSAALEKLDGARVRLIARDVGPRSPVVAHLTRAVKPKRDDDDDVPARWIWRIVSPQGHFELRAEDDVCTIENMASVPAIGCFGVSVYAPTGACEALFRACRPLMAQNAVSC